MAMHIQLNIHPYSHCTPQIHTKEANVGYIKAEDILPEEVIALIQEFVDGETIYIPRKAANRHSWGQGTTYKAELRERNRRIRAEHTVRTPVGNLAKRYHLSEKSIRRILKQQ